MILVRYVHHCILFPMHNCLLEALINMRSGNCENEWSSQPFVLLLLESLLDSYTLYIEVLFVNSWLQLYI